MKNKKVNKTYKMQLKLRKKDSQKLSLKKSLKNNKIKLRNWINIWRKEN